MKMFPLHDLRGIQLIDAKKVFIRLDLITYFYQVENQLHLQTTGQHGLMYRFNNREECTLAVANLGKAIETWVN